MDKYKGIANESFNVIGKYVNLEMNLNTNSQEIKYVKTKGQKLMYDSYALKEGEDLPSVENSRFVGVSTRKGLKRILDEKFESRFFTKRNKSNSSQYR